MIREGINIDFKFQISNFKIKRGFTLLEILIILFVVGIMISGIIPLFLSVITANKSAEHYSTAYRLADSQLEELRSTTFEEIDATYTGIEEGVSSDISDILPEGEIIITVSDEIDGSAQTNIREITIDINWNFKSTKNYTVSTLIAEGGIGR